MGDRERNELSPSYPGKCQAISGHRVAGERKMSEGQPPYNWKESGLRTWLGSQILKEKLSLPSPGA